MRPKPKDSEEHTRKLKTQVEKFLAQRRIREQRARTQAENERKRQAWRKHIHTLAPLAPSTTEAPIPNAQGYPAIITSPSKRTPSSKRTN